MSEKALDESIAHWQRLRDAVQEDCGRAADDEGYGSHECALCDLYAGPNHENENDCQGCPVAAAGHVYCEGSPYKVAAIMLGRWLYERNPEHRAKALAAVEAELEFLESLLPGENHD